MRDAVVGLIWTCRRAALVMTAITANLQWQLHKGGWALLVLIVAFAFAIAAITLDKYDHSLARR